MCVCECKRQDIVPCTQLGIWVEMGLAGTVLIKGTAFTWVCIFTPLVVSSFLFQLITIGVSCKDF